MIVKERIDDPIKVLKQQLYITDSVSMHMTLRRCSMNSHIRNERNEKKML